jgi:urease accessory protein
LFLFLHLRGNISTAIRLGRIGPLEAQRLQARLTPALERVWGSCAHLSLADLATTAPLQDLAHGHHDRLYSRLFTT